MRGLTRNFTGKGQHATHGHCDSMTHPTQRGKSVKICRGLFFFFGWLTECHAACDVKVIKPFSRPGMEKIKCWMIDYWLTGGQRDIGGIYPAYLGHIVCVFDIYRSYIGIYGTYMVQIWNISRTYLRHVWVRVWICVWVMPGTCLGHIWDLSL